MKNQKKSALIILIVALIAVGGIVWYFTPKNIDINYPQDNLGNCWANLKYYYEDLKEDDEAQKCILAGDCYNFDNQECLVANRDIEIELNLDNYFCNETDGGKDFFKKGNLEAVTIFNKTINSKDECRDYIGGGEEGYTSGTEGKYIIEWYCVDNYVESDIFECQNGCFDGACKK